MCHMASIAMNGLIKQYYWIGILVDIIALYYIKQLFCKQPWKTINLHASYSMIDL